MLISYNWLKQYINLPDSVSAQEVGDKLKNAVVEVEKVEAQGADLDKIVVGKVTSVQKHPNADKLNICTVEFGEKFPAQVVCGGSNVVEGMLVAFAPLGAKVRWHGEGELVELKKAKIRDIESYGMICASTEIGLGAMYPLKSEKEILDLTDKNLKVGMPLAEALGLNDAIFEIDNKSLSNRPDLWGHYGIAREVAVLYNRDLKNYETKKIGSGKGFKLKVEVQDKKSCPRYMAVAVENVVIAPSPAWLQNALVAIGLRPINNIVDITNFVMMDLGQPMHAFDAKNIDGKIIVRNAQNNEKFITLDEREHILNENDLVIADDQKAIALAGVMGGLQSGVEDNTNTVIFESANFDSSTVRKTSVRLGLRTDSAQRFEKSLDPNMCEQALCKAVELTLQLCPEAKVASPVSDVKSFSLPVGPIDVPKNIFEKKLGVVIPEKDILNTLTRLGFEVKAKKDIYKITIPTWRATRDVGIAEDIVEEVLRFYGYENIVSALPSMPITPPEKNHLRALEHTVGDVLVKNLAYTETYNYSFVSEQQILALGDDLKKYIELDNPLSKERPYLRRNLLPNLMENVKNNIADTAEVKIFEIGKVFSTNENGLRANANGDELLPGQDSWLAGVYVAKKVETPYWQAVSVLENIFAELKTRYEILPPDKAMAWEHPSRLGLVSVKGKTVGVVCEINPLTANNLGIDQRVGVLQLNLSALSDILEVQNFQSHYKHTSIYPEVVRDLAFLVKKEISHREIKEALKNIDPLLKKVELFDVYEGKNIGEGYKSMAYHLTLGSDDRTLTTAEVDTAFVKAQEKLKKQFDVEVRK
ncbi:MAG: phenylalanine--tRNA ligase subunit beta [Candidatus Magasanikbacteria bacterium]